MDKYRVVVNHNNARWHLYSFRPRSVLNEVHPSVAILVTYDLCADLLAKSLEDNATAACRAIIAQSVLYFIGVSFDLLVIGRCESSRKLQYWQTSLF
jgi:hypothetical protein